MECLIQLDTPKELLLPLVFPLTIASKAAGPSHQMINEFLLQVNKKNLSGGEAAPTGLAEVTTAPTSTSEVYSEICATAQLYCQLCRYVLRVVSISVILKTIVTGQVSMHT